MTSMLVLTSDSKKLYCESVPDTIADAFFQIEELLETKTGSNDEEIGKLKNLIKTYVETDGTEIKSGDLIPKSCFVFDFSDW